MSSVFFPLLRLPAIPFPHTSSTTVFRRLDAGAFQRSLHKIQRGAIGRDGGPFEPPDGGNADAGLVRQLISVAKVIARELISAHAYLKAVETVVLSPSMRLDQAIFALKAGMAILETLAD